MASAIGSLGGLTALSYCGSAACCCGSAAISCCTRRCSSKNSTVTRIAYAVVLLLATTSAWLMLSEPIEKHLSKMEKYSGTPDSCDPTYVKDNSTRIEACQAVWGQLAVYRIMFGSTMFFSLLATIMIGVQSSRDKRGGIQNGWWGPKLLVLIALIVAAFFIKNDFFLKAWGWIGLFGGFIFLLLQLVLLVDFAFAWADSWDSKVEYDDATGTASGCYMWLIMLASLGMYLFSLALTVLMYVFYTKSDESTCADNKAFISINLVLAVLMTAVAISPQVKHEDVMPNSGLLQSGVVVSYCTYLTWSAISETHADSGACQPSSMDTNDDATTVIGALFTFIAVAYSSMRTTPASTIGGVGINKDHADDGEADVLVTSEPSADDDDDLEGQGSGSRRRGGGTRDDETGTVFYNWCFFHLSFVFASLYLMMVLTDWGVMSDRNSHPDFHVGRGKASTWVKIVSGWLSAVIYIWSLIAPICLPDRVFDTAGKNRGK